MVWIDIRKVLLFVLFACNVSSALLNERIVIHSYFAIKTAAPIFAVASLIPIAAKPSYCLFALLVACHFAVPFACLYCYGWFVYDLFDKSDIVILIACVQVLWNFSHFAA